MLKHYKNIIQRSTVAVNFTLRFWVVASLFHCDRPCIFLHVRKVGTSLSASFSPSSLLVLWSRSFQFLRLLAAKPDPRKCYLPPACQLQLLAAKRMPNPHHASHHIWNNNHARLVQTSKTRRHLNKATCAIRPLLQGCLFVGLITKSYMLHDPTNAYRFGNWFCVCRPFTD